MADKSKVKLREFNLIYDFEDVGYLVSAQTQASPGSQYVDVTNAAQFNGVLKSWTNGYIPTVQIQMLETDYQRLFGRLGGEQFRAIVDGAKLSWGIGSRVKELLGKMTILRPVGADAGDYAEDIAFWKGIPDFSQVQITGNRDEANVVTVPFKILPDDTQNIDWTYGRIGDWTAVDTAPGGIFAQFDFAVKHPYKHIPAVTLDSNSKLQAQWFGFWSQDSAVTAAINDVDDITAIDKDVVFDGLSIANGLSVGDYIKIDSEKMEITAIVYTTSTAGTATVRRGIGGTAAAIHLDDAAITLQKNVYVMNVTKRAAHLSSVPADVTVGDSNVTDNKGLMEWASDGASNLTAVIGATTSQTLVVTATNT